VIPAAAGGTWYPQRFTAPVTANEPWLSWALEAVDAAVLSGSPGAVVAGFSQGACLALEYVARHPRRYAGVAALTGGLIGTDAELTRPAGLEGTPVLLTTAEDDPWVPPERTRASAEILEAAGAAVDLRVSPPGPHTVRPDEVAALRDLLA
jgi:phospholipase/carboxylesterase